MFNYGQMIYLIHILLVGPLLIYIGYFKQNTQKTIFDIILIIGIVVVLYHSYKFSKLTNSLKVKVI